jgi:hypothetical protein
MKMVARVSLFAIVASLAIGLSAFTTDPVDSIESVPDLRAYTGKCPDGKQITVCGENGNGCTPKGEC